jgi:hypothetical protein
MAEFRLSIDGKEQDAADHPHLLTTIAKLQPQHVLAFGTGSTVIPGCGWPTRPTINFTHQPTSSYIYSSTCALKIFLPITKGNLSLNSFMFAMAYSLCHGGIFSDI